MWAETVGFARAAARLPGSSSLRPSVQEQRLDRFPPAFMINLDRSHGRLAMARERFGSAGLTFERFPGVDAALDPQRCGSAVDQATFETYMHRRATPGEAGCALSHFALWDKLAEGSAEVLLILEDDAVPTEHFDAIPDILAALPDDWELCLLSSTGTRPFWSRASRSVVIHRFWRPGYSSVGYLVHKRILRHSHVWPPRGKIPFVIDAWRYWFWRHGMAIYAALPETVRHDFEIESTIDHDGSRSVKRRRSLAASMRTGLNSISLYMRGGWHAAGAWWRLRGEPQGDRTVGAGVVSITE